MDKAAQLHIRIVEMGGSLTATSASLAALKVALAGAAAGAGTELPDLRVLDLRGQHADRPGRAGTREGAHIAG